MEKTELITKCARLINQASGANAAGNIELRETNLEELNELLMVEIAGDTATSADRETAPDKT